MEIIYRPKTLEWATIPKICNTNNHHIENKEPNHHLLKDIDDKTYANLTKTFGLKTSRIRQILLQ